MSNAGRSFPILSILLFGVSTLAPHADAESGAGSIVFHAEGKAGDWTLAFTNLTNADCHTITYTLHIEALTPQGVPLGFFISTPQASPQLGEPRYFNGQHFLLSLPHGGALVRDFSVSTPGAYGPDCGGINFAFASNGAWRANITVALPGSGPAAAPDFISTGSGVAFFPGSRGMSLMGGGTSVVDADVAAGWTHLQFNTNYPVPAGAGARIYQVSLPEDTFLVAGQPVPVVAGFASAGAAIASDYFTTIGAQADPAGHVHARVTYAETTIETWVDLIQIPISNADLPPGFFLVDYGSMCLDPNPSIACS